MKTKTNPSVGDYDIIKKSKIQNAFFNREERVFEKMNIDNEKILSKNKYNKEELSILSLNNTLTSKFKSSIGMSTSTRNDGFISNFESSLVKG